MPLPSVASAGALAVIALMPAAVGMASTPAFATPVVRLSSAPRFESEHLPAPVMAALAAPAAGPGPTVAREDTMFTEVPEVLVQAPRVTLDEILGRVARGEARRDSLIVDQQFTATFRMVKGVDEHQTPELLWERVVRVFKKKPRFVRTVPLRTFELHPGKKADVQLSFRSGMDEEIVNFAFRPENRRDNRFRIVGRDFVGGHLIYRIAFEPRSRLDPSQPSGVVWVDTNEFVIVRQEVAFDRSPVPLFIKNVNRMVIERRRFGAHWVLSRVLMRIESTVPLPKLGKGFDLTLQFDDYAMNSGLTDAFFTAGAAR